MHHYKCHVTLICIRGAYMHLHILSMIVIYYYNGLKIVIYYLTPSPTERRWQFTRIIINMISLDHPHHHMAEWLYYQLRLLVRCWLGAWFSSVTCWLIDDHRIIELKWLISHSFEKGGNLLQMWCHHFRYSGQVQLALLMGLPGCFISGGPTVGVLCMLFHECFDNLFCQLRCESGIFSEPAC